MKYIHNFFCLNFEFTLFEVMYLMNTILKNDFFKKNNVLYF